MKKKLSIILMLALLLTMLIVSAFVACKNDDTERLTIPIITYVSNEGLITWESVPNADQYEININGNVMTTSAAFYQLPFKGEAFSHIVSLRALDSTSKRRDSFWSDGKQITELGVPVLQINGNLVTWDEVAGANLYRLIINGTQVITRTNAVRRYNLPPLTSRDFRISIRAEGENVIHSAYSEDFNPTIFQITIHPNNGQETIIRFVAENNVFNISSPTPPYGHFFDGWFTDIGLTIPAVINFPVTMDLNLYAGHIIRSNDIVFNGNGQTSGSTAAKRNIQGGTIVTLPANGFTRTGFNFAGWNTQANGLGITFQPEQIFTMPIGNSNITLFAVWVSKSNTSNN